MDRAVLTRPAPEPDRTLRYGDAPEHVADAWFPATRRYPLLLFVHGGYWRPTYDRVHTRPLAAALRDEGWPVVSVEYRRVPGKPDDLVADVRSALAELPAQLGIRETVLAGHSAGGHLALWAASACPPAGLLGTVPLAPVADLGLAHRLGLGDGAVEAFLGAPPDERPDLDPVRMPAPESPVTIVHGAEDRLPVSVSESYVDTNPAANLVVVPGAAHFEVIDPVSAAWPVVTAVLAESTG
ncbi:MULTISPECIES: alpha/beta hydrolase [Prauserella salsuginis group]|uniref:Alpha/beta hydrolase n=1 Tax=Prauserella salsuginis TaxID=387889 RepID=A0ABW6G1C3_9PSEU|nr:MULTISPECIES: alpha/beta hydrolase [Prauserella salsuginis group]MCR3722143.1 Acetyl esterase/lipase [Prauserella flava]MCR3736140.1 Acetyl esterase/lipase [Prauserella salsuginis]